MKYLLRYSVSLTALALACDFGASKFQVVAGDGDGEGGATGDGDSTTTESGDGDVTTGDGDSSTSGDGDGSGGTGMTGDGDGDASGGTSSSSGGRDGSGGEGIGSGGAASLPTGSCLNQGQPLTILSAASLPPGLTWSDYSWSDFRGVVMVPVGPNKLAVLIELETTQGRAIFYRMVNDQNNWVAEPLSSKNPYENSSLGVANLSAATFRFDADAGQNEDGNLILVVRANDGIGEVSLRIDGGNFNDGVSPKVTDVPVPPDCTSVNDGHVRNILPDFGLEGTLYAITCQNSADQLRPYVQVADPGLQPKFEPLNGWSNDVSTQIIRFIPNGTPSGPTYFFQMGGDFGDAGYRYAPAPNVSLPSSTTRISLDDNRVTALFTSRVMGSADIFMVGAAVTATNPDSPEFVPADLYASIVKDSELPGFGTVTPAADVLNRYGSINDITKVFKISQPAQFGSYFYYVGENYASLSSIALSMLDRDGNALVRDHVLAEDPAAQLSAPVIAGMGGSLFIVYSKLKDGTTELLGQRVLCGPNAN